MSKTRITPLPEEVDLPGMNTVHIGKGGEFESGRGDFRGWAGLEDISLWKWGWWNGGTSSLHYAVTIDSPILKLGDNARIARGKAPIEDWLRLLPDGISERALAQKNGVINTAASLEEAVYGFCNWGKTEEGQDFWFAVWYWCIFDTDQLPVSAENGVQAEGETPAPSRKEYPLYSGVLRYFPDALMEVSRCSYIGNEQHHPGTPLHWDRSKSTDELDALMRHLKDAGTLDTDGVRHSAKAAWRALANLQKEIENER